MRPHRSGRGTRQLSGAPVAATGCIAALFALLVLDGDVVERWVASEDGVAENIGAAAFLGASVAYGSTLRRSRRAGDAVLALAFLVAAGEELAWGQHAFDFDPPETIKHHNVQEDFTVHNLELVSVVAGFDVLFAGFLAFVLTYVLVLPRLVAGGRRLGHLASAHLSVGPSRFAGPLILTLALSVAALSSGSRTHAVTETAEAALAMLLFAAAIDARRSHPAVVRAPSGRSGRAARPA